MTMNLIYMIINFGLLDSIQVNYVYGQDIMLPNTENIYVTTY